jgi:hypothetical protein
VKFDDPALEKVVADIYRSLGTGLTTALTVEDTDGDVHTLTFKDGILTGDDIAG